MVRGLSAELSCPEQQPSWAKPSALQLSVHLGILGPKAMVKYELRALKQIGLIGCGGFGTVTLQRCLP